MVKFLISGNYIGEGIKGLLSEGGSSRRTAIEKLANSLGGNVECIYYAFGKYDIYGIINIPDRAAMAAFSLKASATGLVKVKCTALLTPEEIDEAVKKTSEYRAPGQSWFQ
jgi:uncharacterized protein with GYD domain